MARISDIFEEHLSLVRALREQIPSIQTLGELVIQRLQNGARLLLCGNGGSAADAQHIATELACRYETWRQALPAIALTTDSSMLTATGNDLGFEQVFARGVEAQGRPGDILLCISTSGNSPNILEAARAARRLGLISIGLLGRDGGPLAALVDHALIVPGERTARIQECHILIGHIWCAMIDAAFATTGSN
jgi:phosphoheptose isomerase